MAAPVRHEKAASSINCKDFDSDVHDFDNWVKKFEKAVKLATNVRDEPSLHYLYKEWLPLKLDDLASTYLDQIGDVAWANTKTRLSDLLVDPQMKLRWRARQWTITWDGKESMHALAARVKRAVDKYDRHLPEDVRESEYFVRFRCAFKKPLMRVIDMNCPEGSQTIDTAKDAMMRYLLANAEDDSSAPASASGDIYKGVAFASANLNPDRATSLETSLASIATQMETIALSVRKVDDRQKGFEQRLRSLEDHRGDRRDSSYDRGYRSNNYSSRGDRRSRDSWDDRDRNRGRSPSPRRYSPGGDRRDRNRRDGDRKDRNSGPRGGNAGRGRDRSRDRDDSRDRGRDYSDDRNDSRSSRRDNRSYDRGSSRRDQASGSRDRSDNYRAIETGDEWSSDDQYEDSNDSQSNAQASGRDGDDSTTSSRGQGGN